MLKNILVTGGAGYVGSELVKSLLDSGHHVTVLDWFIYSSQMKSNNTNLKMYKGDIRDEKIVNKSLENIDTVIHLACISNDPSAILDKELSLSVNQNGFETLVKACLKSKSLKKFIFASSSSIYGISEAENVYEDHPKVPVSLYNITKAWCEDLLFQKYKDLPFVIVRPATICGLSSRMRFDLAVNMLTAQSITNKKITVFGGKQFRPNLNIKDAISLYKYFLDESIDNHMHEIYNASYINLSLEDIALKIKNTLSQHINIDIEFTESDDPRSYRVNCDKLISKGFEFSHTIEDAVKSIFNNFNFEDPLSNPNYNNTLMMKIKKIK